jgi:predicted tellurium resistance membrane protein TerC
MDFFQTYFSFVSTPEGWIALVTLVTMEVVLGIDNLIFISILSNKLPAADRARARRLGIGAALLMRLLLLATISWITQLTQPVFTALGHDFSWRDLILIGGGLFLVWKATKEIHHTVDPDDGKENMMGSTATLTVSAAIVQILLLDLVFSVDSIITAVGMTDEIAIMYIAVIVAVAAMLLAADPLARFIQANPSIVMLALSFLLMIGMTLIAEGMGFHVPKGYVYAAMGFSALVEALNMFARRAAATSEYCRPCSAGLFTGRAAATKTPSFLSFHRIPADHGASIHLSHARPVQDLRGRQEGSR